MRAWLAGTSGPQAQAERMPWAGCLAALEAALSLLVRSARLAAIGMEAVAENHSLSLFSRENQPDRGA
jgi:hypothetical protein